MLRDEIAGGAQAISVQHTAGITTVAEEQGGGAIPWLHQDGVILIESLQILGDRVLLVEALRHQHRHGMWQAHARGHEKLQHIV